MSAKDQLIKLFDPSRTDRHGELDDAPAAWRHLGQMLAGDILPNREKRSRHILHRPGRPGKAHCGRTSPRRWSISAKFQEQVDLMLGLEPQGIRRNRRRAWASRSRRIRKPSIEIRRKGHPGEAERCRAWWFIRAAAPRPPPRKPAPRFAGPFVQQPKISTGAGDHFNAGFCLGRGAGANLEESLCTGVATSGYYVRNATSPTGKQLAEFIANLPAPQG